jgi:glycosyltransferase involved in cell wall biosynthesis
VRILHVSDCYLPRLGGIEVQVHHLARRQQAAGHQVEVATATPPARHDRTRQDMVEGVPVHRMTVDLPFELPVNPWVGRQLAALLADAAASGRPFDAAHVHTGVVSQFAYTAVPALRAGRVPTVLTVHSIWGPATVAFRVVDLVIRWSRWPVVFSAVSAVAARPLRALVPDGDVRVIPNGIDPALWQVDRLPRDPGEVLLASVMRLAPRKRGVPLLRMLGQVRAQVPATVSLRALVVGDGPERQRMQHHLDRHDLGWVELAGRWDRAAIHDLYRRADLFVAPSDLESFGIAALEARTAGVPVVAKAGTGVTEFVTDGVHGVLAATDAGLVEAVAALAVDPDRRAALAANCRNTPPPTTWDDVLRRCDDAYAAAAVLARR